MSAPLGDWSTEVWNFHENGFCKFRFSRQGKLHPLWTKLHGPKELNKSTCNQLLLTYDCKTGEILTSPTSPKTREETTLGSSFPNEIFLGTPLKAAEVCDTKFKLLHAGDFARVSSPLSAWDFYLVQELLQPTLAAAMMPKKTKLQTPHISRDA